jgi:hypothetical protein
VQHDGEARKLLLDLGQNIETQFGRNEDALGVAGALFGLELVGAVRGADRDGQRIHAGLGYEIHDVLGIGVGVVLGRNLVLHTGQYAQLAFYRHVELVCVVDHLLGERHVLLIGEVRTVDHHRREAHVDAALAKLERVAVVEVQNDRNVLAQLLGIFDGALSHVAEQGLVGVFARARRHLKNYRRRSLHASLNDGLHLLHVVEVECRDGITALDGLCEHLTGVHKTQIFVGYHSNLIYAVNCFSRKTAQI